MDALRRSVKAEKGGQEGRQRATPCQPRPHHACAQARRRDAREGETRGLI